MTDSEFPAPHEGFVITHIEVGQAKAPPGAPLWRPWIRGREQQDGDYREHAAGVLRCAERHAEEDRGGHRRQGRLEGAGDGELGGRDPAEAGKRQAESECGGSHGHDRGQPGDGQGIAGWMRRPRGKPRQREESYFAPLTGLAADPVTELNFALVPYHPAEQAPGTTGDQVRLIDAALAVSPGGSRDWGICTECGMGRVSREDIPALLDLHRQIVAAR